VEYFEGKIALARFVEAELLRRRLAIDRSTAADTIPVSHSPVKSAVLYGFYLAHYSIAALP